MMENNVYNFKINIDWELIGVISQIDRFDATWSTIEKKEGKRNTIKTVYSS
jgi:hypothetical protein